MNMGFNSNFVESIFRCNLIDGFVFTAITNPANKYDAIVIRNPIDCPCSSPLLCISNNSLDEHIEYINKNNITKAMVIADDINFIKECPSLTCLEIIPSDTAPNNFDYSPLYNLPNLKSLRCRTKYGRYEKHACNIDYSPIKTIECLSVDGFGHDKYNVLPNLKSLMISNYKGEDISYLANKKIDLLKLVQCNIKSLKGLEKMENMKCLYLHYLRFLQDIASIRYVKKSLTALIIDKCSKINDFSVIEELENLEYLELCGQNSLQSLDFIYKLKNLKTFIFDVNIIDGDLSPCLNLSCAVSVKNRKHYNLKNSHLPKNQYVFGNETIEDWRQF